MSASSPYDNARIITYPDGEQSLDPIINEPVLTEKVHTVLPGETLQSISYKYFGDSGRWGDIMQANNLLNPFTEIQPYDQLIIPL